MPHGFSHKNRTPPGLFSQYNMATLSGENNDYRFIAGQVAQQSIATSTWTKIEFDDELLDPLSEYDPTTNYRYSPKTAGWYHFNIFTLIWYATTNSLWQVGLYKNGVLQNKNQMRITYAVVNYMNSSWLEYSSPGDYWEAYAWQNTGSNKDIGFSGDANSYFYGLRART